MTRRGPRCKALISAGAALPVLWMAGLVDGTPDRAPALWRDINRASWRPEDIILVAR
jgi:hypothetical protein